MFNLEKKYSKVLICQSWNILLIASGQEQEANDFKKKMLRYLLLSWAITMSDVCGKPHYKEFSDENLISKLGLATKEEMKRINKYGYHLLFKDYSTIPQIWDVILNCVGCVCS